MAAMSDIRLTRQQALLIQALLETPGEPVAWPELASAMGIPEWHATRQQVSRTVWGIRQQCGQDAIKTARPMGYYTDKETWS
jgi:DNA-binding response OmpR family regulator